MNDKADHVLANMEQLGAQTVRDMISSGVWPANYDALAKEWLRQKKVEEGGRNEAQTQKDTREPERKVADGESQMLLARESNELAHSAKEAALDANKRADDADKRAEGANAMARDAKNIACAAAASVEDSAGTVKTIKRIAIAAMVVALIAVAIPIAALFIRWPPALEALIYIILRK